MVSAAPKRGLGTYLSGANATGLIVVIRSRIKLVAGCWIQVEHRRCGRKNNMPIFAIMAALHQARRWRVLRSIWTGRATPTIHAMHAICVHFPPPLMRKWPTRWPDFIYGAVAEQHGK